MNETKQIKRVWVCKECGEDEWVYDDRVWTLPCKPCAIKGRWVRLTLKKGA